MRDGGDFCFEKLNIEGVRKALSGCYRRRLSIENIFCAVSEDCENNAQA
jgi:hypothetical protein